jgi:hypothetical protein
MQKALGVVVFGIDVSRFYFWEEDGIIEEEENAERKAEGPVMREMEVSFDDNSFLGMKE